MLQLTATDSAWPNRIRHYSHEREAWEDMPVPQEFVDALPQVADAVQRDWNQLFREFVADIRGEGYSGYATFHDGWVAAEVIKIVRRGHGWTALPERPDAGRLEGA